jgi:hypothetical protein
MGSGELFSQGWLGTMILQSSAFQVARIIGVSHWCPVKISILDKVVCYTLHMSAKNAFCVYHKRLKHYILKGWGQISAVKNTLGLKTDDLNSSYLPACCCLFLNQTFGHSEPHR